MPGNKHPKTAHLPKWKPGTSGNPAGVPKATLARREQLVPLYEMSVANIKEALLCDEPKRRDEASYYVVNQVIGKAPAEVKVNTDPPIDKTELVDWMFEILAGTEADKKPEERN